MFNKFYEKTKQFIIENYRTFLFFLVLIATLNYRLPYFIYTKGGTIDTKNRVEIENAYESKGSFHFAYVSQIYATIPTYILAHILPDWDIEKIEDYQISEEETSEEIALRDHLYLEEANTAAIFNAYKKAGKRIQIDQKKLHIIYIENKDKNNLKIGDQIKSVEGEKINELEDLKKIVNRNDVGDTLKIEVIREKNTVSCSAEIIEKMGQKMLGISMVETYDYKLEPNLILKFKNSESGSSGGLMLALTIYDRLTEEDLTKGKKIVGTGTIDKDGNIGTIGGVSYKLEGAVSSGADIFLVPNKENYETCKKIKEEKNLKIEIIGVDTFEEAIQKLKAFQ